MLTVRRYNDSDHDDVWTLHTLTSDLVGANAGASPTTFRSWLFGKFTYRCDGDKGALNSQFLVSSNTVVGVRGNHSERIVASLYPGDRYVSSQGKALPP